MTAESAERQGPEREAGPGAPKGPPPPDPPRRRGRHLRRQPPPEPPPRGQLRLRSPAGAFVIVGVCVVLVGMSIAVVGYWPHRARGGSGAGAGNASVPGDVSRELAAGHLVPHGEKLKLVGPVIMGIGLFIFICANTMLYENRDMETRQLMQKGLYGLAVGLPEGPSPEGGHGPSVPRASAECVEGCYQVDLSCQPCPGPSSKWSGRYGPSGLQAVAELLQRPAASPAGSPHIPRCAAAAPSPPCRSLLSSAVGALALPIIKLNNCLLDGAGRGPAEHPPAAPRLSRAPPSPGDSAAPRGAAGDGDGDGNGDGDGVGGHVVISMDGSCPGTVLSPALHPHTPGHSRSLDLGQPAVLLPAPGKDRRNRSWPRLDRVSLVGCAKLGSSGESSDRLLEPGEPRPSSWVLGVQQGTRV